MEGLTLSETVRKASCVPQFVDDEAAATALSLRPGDIDWLLQVCNSADGEVCSSQIETGVVVCGEEVERPTANPLLYHLPLSQNGGSGRQREEEEEEQHRHHHCLSHQATRPDFTDDRNLHKTQTG